MEMSYREAARRIQEHKEIHYKEEYPHAILITKALDMAIDLLNRAADLEDAQKNFSKGDDIWYVDAEMNEIEKGTVDLVTYKNGKIDTIGVLFEDDFDEFDGSGLGHCLFATESAAKNALMNYQE